MPDLTPEDGWLRVGLDDDGAPLFIDLRSVRTRGGLRLDRLEITVIVKPVKESDSFRALQELLSKAGKSSEEPAYVEQHWVLHLPKRLFAIRRLSVKGGDGATLHLARLSDIDLSTIERASVAEQVTQAVERLLQERSLVLQIPDAHLPAKHARSQTSPTVNLHRDVTNLGTPRSQTGATPRAVRRVGSGGVWDRLLRRLRK